MTWISIIYLLLNKSSAEKVAVGILMSNNEESICRIHYKKAQSALRVVGKSDIWKSIKSSLEGYETSFTQIDHQTSMFAKPISKKRVVYFNESLEGTIWFGEPFDSALPFSNKTLDVLSNHYLGYALKERSKNSVRRSNLLLKRLKAIPDIHDYASLNVEVKPINFEDIFAPKTVDMLALNGTYLHAHYIDLMSVHLDKTAKHIEDALLIHRGFEKKAKAEKRDTPKALFYYSAIQNENGERLFSQLTEYNINKELLSIDKADSIIEELKRSDYKPFVFDT